MFPYVCMPVHMWIYVDSWYGIVRNIICSYLWSSGSHEVWVSLFLFHNINDCKPQVNVSVFPDP